MKLDSQNTGSILDLLCLVLEECPTKEVVDSWSSKDKEAVTYWAALEHLYAADNYIERIPKPDIIQGYN